MAPASLSSWEVEGVPAIPDKEWERCGPWPMASLFQKEGWKVTMTSPLDLLRSGGL